MIEKNAFEFLHLQVQPVGFKAQKAFFHVDFGQLAGEARCGLVLLHLLGLGLEGLQH